MPNVPAGTGVATRLHWQFREPERPDSAVDSKPATDAHPPSARSRVWSAYWQQGALHSLPTSFPDNYEGEIREFWAGMLAGLDARHRMLDIGTGNGALPRLALDLRGHDSPQVDAIDAAHVAPDWHSALPASTRGRIRFHGHVHAEQLPFPDGHFDLVTSQYGFEYTDTAATAAEAWRVLREGGRLGLVMHHAGSRLHLVAAAEAEGAAVVSGPAGFLQRAMDLIPWLAMAARGEVQQLRATPAAGKAREDFNAAAAALGARIETGQDSGLLADVREYVFRLVQALQGGRVDESAARAHLASYMDTVAHAQVRSAELCRHALTEDGMQRLHATLADAGFSDLRASTLRHDGMLMGWGLQAVRA